MRTNDVGVGSCVDQRHRFNHAECRYDQCIRTETARRCYGNVTTAPWIPGAGAAVGAAPCPQTEDPESETSDLSPADAFRFGQSQKKCPFSSQERQIERFFAFSQSMNLCSFVLHVRHSNFCRSTL
ncbi:hypothetical protein BVRB_022500 [Beta vulgaris subsp. vulgaris]|uniref:Uncharacterized protein n=1 Tax=Beta vulgaris subsp. vulgaris TaxID=3555 RepID=A0A0J8AZY5_BETVV|nr:hypothetical protein BVRB_022500 [Beta vulgaris subsp. vulgaris]